MKTSLLLWLAFPLVCLSGPDTDSLTMILQSHAEAMGGFEAWDNLQTWQIKQHRKDGWVLTPARLPDAFRLEFHIGSRHLIKSFDGNEGWYWENGERSPMRPGEAIEMAEEPEFYGELVYAAQAGKDLRYLGLEELDGQPCYKLELHKHGGDIQSYWISSENWLLIQCGEYSEDTAHEGMYYTTRFEDYRSVNGLMFPFRERLLANGKLKASWTMESIEINPDLPEDFFSAKP